MIGAAAVTMAAIPATPSGIAAGDARASDADPVAEAVPAPAGEVRTPVVRGPAGHAAHADGTKEQAAAPLDFATLLTSAEVATAPALPPSKGSGTDEKDRPAEPLDATALPGQLLALLDAGWMKAGLAPASQAPAQPAAANGDATAAIAAGAAAKPGLPGPVPMPATLGTAATAEPLPQEAPALPPDASPISTPVDPGQGTMATPDANGAVPVFPALLHSGAPAARSMLATPVPFPADPQAGFDDGFGARLAWMAEQRLGHAEIRLSPEHLGPIEVRVQVDGTQVSAEFHSAHASVRQAIEASVPRLREMLGQQGLQLGHADVGQRRPGTGANPGQHPEPGVPGESMDARAIRHPLRSRGLVDEYA